MGLRRVWIWFTLILAAYGAYGQTDTLRPGLVLSGGGAKGYAHLGVLKVLEESRLTPAYLTGTSIGAIVGAYYAAGYSADEIKRKFHEMDMKNIMQDKLPRRYLPLYEKKAGRDQLFYFPIDKKTLAIHLPQGLTNYQLFYNRLFKDLFVIQYVENFDDLPVKVRFFATDLVEGKTVAFRSGSIPRAVVASSAFPSIVAPIKIDGQLLTDGGVLNNYPVDELYALGANYSIGVDVQGRLHKQSEIKSIAEILDQITGIYMYANMPEKRQKTHIYIRPAVEDFSVTDFEILDTAFVLGYQAAEVHKNHFRRLAEHQPDIQRPEPYTPDSLYFNRIVLQGDIPTNQEQFLWRANISTGQKISFDDFETGINYLYGTGDYKQLHYWIKPDSTLVMDIQKDTINLKLKLGYQYTPLYKINLLAGIVHRNFLKENGLFDVEFILGDPLRYNLNILFDNGYHFGYGLYSSLHQFNRNVSYPLFFDDVEDPSFQKMDLHYGRLRNQAYFLTMLSTNFNMKLGAEHLHYNIYTTVFSPTDDQRKYYLSREHYGGGFFDLYYDDMDDFYFPSHGVMINFHGSYYVPFKSPRPNSGFYQIDFLLTGARKHSHHFSTSYEFRAGIITHQDPPLPFYYYMGGIEHHNPVENLIPFYSRDYLQFKTSSYVLFQPQVQRQWNNHFFQLGIQGLLYEEPLPARFESIRSYYNVYLRYGLKSFFGPVFVTYAYEPVTQENRLNFSIGFFF